MCVHHWMIEPAKGKWSKGKCRYCKKEGKFLNNTDDPFLNWGRIEKNGAGILSHLPQFG